VVTIQITNDLHIEVQQVQHESRVHLDIETDDIEAEVKRLESLGARRIRQVHTCGEGSSHKSVVTAAPTARTNLSQTLTPH
jgi:hypothetical protein